MNVNRARRLISRKGSLPSSPVFRKMHVHAGRAKPFEKLAPLGLVGRTTVIDISSRRSINSASDSPDSIAIYKRGSVDPHSVWAKP